MQSFICFVEKISYYGKEIVHSLHKVCYFKVHVYSLLYCIYILITSVYCYLIRWIYQPFLYTVLFFRKTLDWWIYQHFFIYNIVFFFSKYWIHEYINFFIYSSVVFSAKHWIEATLRMTRNEVVRFLCCREIINKDKLSIRRLVLPEIKSVLKLSIQVITAWKENGVDWIHNCFTNIMVVSSGMVEKARVTGENHRPSTIKLTNCPCGIRT